MKSFFKPLLCLLACCFCSGLYAQEVPKWELVLTKDQADFGTLICSHLPSTLIAGLKKQASINDLLKKNIKVFFARTSEENKTLFPGMLGDFVWRDSSLVFKPRLPFLAGEKYQIITNFQSLCELGSVSFLEDQWPKKWVDMIAIPDAEKGPTTYVEAVYPSTKKVPANLLKFYIYFSAPMSQKSSYPHIRLLEKSGREVAAPFLELSPELWDRNRKRLTIWLDPGRIKTHLIPNQQKGNPLEIGKEYTLTIDATMKDARGQCLKNTWTKTFFTLPPDRQKPKQEDWQISTPESFTRQALQVHFSAPMDRALMESVIAVFDAQGQMVEGQIKVSDKEQVFAFTPATNWQAGDYHIKIGTEIEDLAGNNLERLFDTDVSTLAVASEDIVDSILEDSIEIGFTINITPRKQDKL